MTRTELASKVYEEALESGENRSDAAFLADCVIYGRPFDCPVCGGKGWIQTAPGLGESPADAQVICPLCNASDTRQREPVTEAAPF